jgi:hypothetical protein
MWPPPTLAIAALFVAAAFSTTVQAQSNSWCAFFSGGPTNCGFTTFEDCVKAIKGKTGLCDRKSQDVAPAGPDPAAAGPGLAAGGNACAARFRSYDPASGTYLGFDGRRHPCQRRHRED